MVAEAATVTADQIAVTLVKPDHIHVAEVTPDLKDLVVIQLRYVLVLILILASALAVVLQNLVLRLL